MAKRPNALALLRRHVGAKAASAILRKAKKLQREGKNLHTIENAVRVDLAREVTMQVRRSVNTAVGRGVRQSATAVKPVAKCVAIWPGPGVAVGLKKHSAAGKP